MMNALVTIRNGEVRASSHDVAAAFDKEHKNVVRAIDNMIKLAPQISRLNFEPRESIVRGRPYRGYEMDRDGFSLLAMGFTGSKALEWKLKFLDAFKRMEEALLNSMALNDNGLAKLHPLLQTTEGRDALWKGREQVRLMKELKGRDAAMALWLELGLPIPRNFDRYIETGSVKRNQAQGEMIGWIEAHGVKVNDGVATDWSALWDNYFNWCFLHNFTPYEPEKFKKHLRIHFGAGCEVKRGVFGIEIGADR